MRIYTHWVCEEGEDGRLVGKKFFPAKGEEEQAAKAAKKQGRQVLARHDWKVEPTAKAVSDFCSEQMNLREYIETPEGPAEENYAEMDLDDLI